MSEGALGRRYEDGEVIVRQGDEGDCMFVVQEGEVEVMAEKEGRQVRLAVRKQGDFFGEMALFEKEVRMATVRALGPATVLTVDRKNFVQRIHQDPSIAFRMARGMSKRIRELSEEVARLKRGGPGERR